MQSVLSQMALRWLNQGRTISRDLGNFDVNDARTIRNKKRNVENAMFEYLWKMLMQKIVMAAKTSWELTYCVPDKLPGLPPYDPVLVARRMRLRLKGKDFRSSRSMKRRTAQLSSSLGEKKRNPHPSPLPRLWIQPWKGFTKWQGKSPSTNKLVTQTSSLRAA